MTNIEVISSDNVLEALRLWHGGDSPNWPLAKLRIALQIPLQKETYGSLAEAGPAAQNRAILSLGLDELKKAAPEAEDLLRARFEHRRDVISVANSLNISEPSVYYRQRQAVHQLTEFLLQLESAASADWRNQMTSRLELQTYSQLVGVEQSRAALREALMDQSHFIVALDGLGGIGKTALADQIARDLIQTTRFDEIAWITAKHTHLSTLGRLQIESGRPALTFPMLVDKLANQFDLPQQDDDHSQLERQRLVKHFLRSRACLVVIDNLETVADYHSLLPELRKWRRPTKFLLTSRLRLLDEPDVFSLPLKELTIDSAYRLIRFEAKRTGFTDLAKASDADLQAIYLAVGGNPLALKLVIGQLRFHSLSHVLKRFGQVNNQSSEAGIFDYIYREIWETLDDTHKMALLALTQAGETGFSLDHLAAISTLSIESVSRSLEKLILLSMVDLSGNLLKRRYRLHRLTEVFLLKMFAEK